MRRLISLLSVSVALVGLGLVLWNATTVDRTPPTIRAIVLSAPAGDPHRAQALTAIDVEFSEPVQHATVEAHFHIDPAVAGAFSWDGSTAIFTPSQKLPADADFTVRIDPGVADLAGNVDPVGLTGWDFRTVGAPVVLRTTPADGSSGVPASSQLELVFDRLMDTASVEQALTIQPAAAMTPTWSGSLLTIDFGDSLTFGTTYTLTIGAAAADTGGTRLGTAFTTRFTTVATGLAIRALVPGDGVAGIAIGTPIAVQFDAPINPDTARAALHIVPSVDGDVRIVARAADLAGPPASPAPAPDTLLFQPSSPLAVNTTYTVTLDPTVARADDPTAVFAGRTWSFTTGSPTSSGQNQIAFLSARGGVRNVWVMNPDGTNQREVTSELAPVSTFDASADGSLIAEAAGGTVTVLSIDGTRVTHVTVADGRREYAPAFTPDDEHLVLARRGADGTDQGYWLVPLPGAGGSERQLLDHGAPQVGSGLIVGDGIAAGGGTGPWARRIAFDPDGTAALLVTSTGEVDLVDVGQPGLGQPTAAPIRLDLAAAGAPAWVASRGAFVVAATGTDGVNRLVAVDERGTTTVIGGGTGAVGPVSASPSGTVAALARGTDGVAHVWLIARDGSTRELPAPAGEEDRFPVFSPDGQSILVGRVPLSERGVSDGIWLLDAATGAGQELAGDGAYARWIP